MTVADEWGAFHAWLEARGRTPDTARQYVRYARRALCAGVRTPDEVDERAARSAGERKKMRQGVRAHCEYQEACA